MFVGNWKLETKGWSVLFAFALPSYKWREEIKLLILKLFFSCNAHLQSHIGIVPSNKVFSDPLFYSSNPMSQHMAGIIIPIIDKNEGLEQLGNLSSGFKSLME